MPGEPLHIDGSWGEGGGQVLRTSLALSIITGRPIRLTRIRAGRPKPGLQPQHLASVRAAARISGARVSGDAIGSREIRFEPGEVQPGAYRFDVAEERASAGSTTLIFQTVCLPLALAGESYLLFAGGTHNPWAPPYPFLERVFLPALAPIGLDVRTHLHRSGWYPIGKGGFDAEIPSRTRLRPVRLEERGALRRLACYSASSNLPEHVRRRQAGQAEARLEAEGLTAEVEMEELPSSGIGSVLFLLAEFEHCRAGFTGLGERGKRAERVADEACDALLAFLATDAPVGPHLADQIALPLALAGGASHYRTSEVTLHLLTNLHVIEQFLPVRATVEGTEGIPGRVTLSAK